jgi:WS/DGAT/MGAT family acyltransferase
MEHLSTLDAGFLEAEDSDRRVSLAIGALAVLDGPIPDHEPLMSTLGERIGHCPRFAQRLRRRPFDLGAPEWVHDDDFDLAHHVRRIAVPAPGEDQQLYGLVAEVMSWRLDRTRPLWEIWVIDGLSGNRWAMLMKVHHCIADGIAAAHMLAGLSDNGIGDTFPGHRRSVGEPAGQGALWRTVHPANWIPMVRGTMRTLQGAAEVTAGLLRPAPSSLNGSLTNLRRYGAARVSLDDVKRVCQTFEVTINDVALAALTESYRAMLLRRGEQPAPDALRTLVPVSVRSADALDKTDNRVSLMLPHLPVDEDHPVQRLRAVHARLSRTKATGQHRAGSLAVAAANRVPFALTSLALRVVTRLPQRGVVALATNVPGPHETLQIMGRPVVQVLPIPPIAMQLRTGVAILSYGDELFVGILADFDAVPDVAELARGVEVAVNRLVASSKRRKPGRDRRGLSLVVSA